MPDEVVVRRSGNGWQVEGEEPQDLTSAMALADLISEDLGLPAPPPRADMPDEAARLAVTVAQLEHALAARVRVEQAIGVLAERFGLRPRQAFELLRKAARSRSMKVLALAEAVVDSASSPAAVPRELLRPRRRGYGHL